MFSLIRRSRRRTSALSLSSPSKLAARPALLPRGSSLASLFPSFFPAASRCLSGESLSAHHARATFDLYAHKSHFVVAIHRASGAIESLYSFPLPRPLFSLSASSTFRFPCRSFSVPFRRRHQPHFFDPLFLIHPLFLCETSPFCPHFAPLYRSPSLKCRS